MAQNYKTGLIITGDASGGIRAIKATDDELGKLNKGFDKGSRQSKKFGADAERAGRQLTEIDRGAGVATRGLETLRRAAAPIAGAIAGMFAANTIQNQVDWGDQLQKTNLRIGASTESLSQYNYVAKLSGVEFGQLTTAWQRQTRRIAEAAAGTGVASKALDRLGLSAKDLNQLAPEEQFERIATAMQNVESSSERVALAQKLWDSEGVKLVQIVNQGTDAIAAMRAEADALGLTISQDTANAMASYNDEVDRLKFAAQGLSQTLAGELVPSMTAGLQATSAFIQQVGGADAILETAADAATMFAVVMGGRLVGALTKSTQGMISDAAAAVAQAKAHATATTAARAKAAETLRVAQADQAAATRALANGHAIAAATGNTTLRTKAITQMAAANQRAIAAETAHTAAVNVNSAAMARGTVAAQGMAAATRTGASALALIGGPAGAALIAGAGLYYFREELGLTDDKMQGTIGTIESLGDSFVTEFGNIGAELMGGFRGIRGGLIDIDASFIDLKASAVDSFAGIVASSADVINLGLIPIQHALNALDQGFANWINRTANAFESAGDMPFGMANLFGEQVSRMRNMADDLTEGMIEPIGISTAALDNNVQAWRDQADAMRNTADAVRNGTNPAAQETVAVFKTLDEWLLKTTESTDENTGSNVASAAASREAAESTAAQAKALEDLYNRLRPGRRETIQMARDIGTLNLAMATGTGNIARHAQSMQLLALEYLNAQGKTKDLATASEDAGQSIARSFTTWGTIADNTIRDLDDTGRDAWLGLIDGSTSALDTVERAFEQTFANIAHMLTTQKLTFEVAGMMGLDTTGMPGGGGQSAGGFDLGSFNPSNLTSGIDTVGGWFKGGATAAPGGFTSQIGGTGSYSGWAGSATGTGYGPAASGGGWMSTAGSMAGTAAAAYGAYQIGSAIGDKISGLVTDKQAQSSWGQNIGAAGGFAIGGPVGAGIGSAIGSVVDSVFGSDSAVYKGKVATVDEAILSVETVTQKIAELGDAAAGEFFGITDTGSNLRKDLGRARNNSYFEGGNNEEYYEVGAFGAVGFKDRHTRDLGKGGEDGWWDEVTQGAAQVDNMVAALARGEDEFEAMKTAVQAVEIYSENAQDLVDAFTQTRPMAAIDAMTSEYGKFVQALDGSVEEIVTRAQQGASILAQAEGINDLIGDEVMDRLQGISGSAEFDQMAAGLEQSVQAVSLLMGSTERLNLQFDATSAAALDAAGDVAQQAGGVQNLAALNDSYYQSYFTAAERTAHLQDDLTESMAAMGLELPENEAGFRALVEAQNQNTEAGGRNYVQLLQLSGGFSELTQMMGDTAANVDVQLAQYRTLNEELMIASGAWTDSTVAILDANAALDTLNMSGKTYLEAINQLSKKDANQLRDFADDLGLSFERVQDIIGDIIAGNNALGGSGSEQAPAATPDNYNSYDAALAAYESAQNEFETLASQIDAAASGVRGFSSIIDEEFNGQIPASIDQALATLGIEAPTFDTADLDAAIDDVEAYTTALSGLSGLDAERSGFVSAAQNILDSVTPENLGSALSSITSAYEQAVQEGLQAGGGAVSGNSISGEIEQSVYNAYQEILGRKPDLEGFEWWVNELESGAASLSDMQDAFRDTSEFDLRGVYQNLLDDFDDAQSLYEQIQNGSIGLGGSEYSGFLDALQELMGLRNELDNFDMPKAPDPADWEPDAPPKTTTPGSAGVDTNARDLERLKQTLLQAQGDWRALREIELDTLSSGGQEIQQQIYALEDRNAALSLITQSLSSVNPAAASANTLASALETLSFTSENTAQSVLTAISEMDADTLTGHFAETGVSADDASTAIAALTDEMQRAAEVASSHTAMSLQIAEMTGNTAAYERLLAAQRQQELAQTDASLRPLKERIWALQDEEEATKRAAEARQTLESGADDALQALDRAISAEQQSLSDAHDEQMERYREQISETSGSISELETLVDSLHRALRSTVVESDELDRQRLSAARSYIATAAANGITTLTPQLESALDLASGDNQRFYSTFEDYARDQLTTAHDIAALNTSAESELTVEQRMLKSLESQTTAADQQHDEAMRALDKQLEEYREQINALNGIDDSVLSVADAVEGVELAISRLAARDIELSHRLPEVNGDGNGDGGSEPTAPPANTDPLGELLSRYPAPVHGAIRALYERGLRDDELTSRLPAVDGSHANGLWTVPHDGYIAELHKDESVLKKSDAEAWRQSRFMPAPAEMPMPKMPPLPDFNSQAFSGPNDIQVLVKQLEKLVSTAESQKGMQSETLKSLKSVARQITRWDDQDRVRVIVEKV